MTRQVVLVFFGKNRAAHDEHHEGEHAHTPHESPLVMTAPLMILAVCAIALGFIGTPAWPWFQDFLEGHHAEFIFAKLTEDVLSDLNGKIAVGGVSAEKAAVLK